MDFAVRSHVHLPPAAVAETAAARIPTGYQPLDTALRRPSIHLPQAQQYYQETARLPPAPAPPSSSSSSSSSSSGDAYTTANYNPRTRLSIAHVTDGLRTPPPEMTSSYPATRVYPARCTGTPVHIDYRYPPVAPSEQSADGMNHRRQDTSSSHQYPAVTTATATRSPMQQHYRPQTADSNRSSASYAQHSQPPPQPTQQQQQAQQTQHDARAKQEPQAKQQGTQEEGSSRSRSVSRPSGATLTVPSTILENSDLSLSDFAAQITCLFWFESTFTIHRVAESSPSVPAVPIHPLARDAVPSTGFRKWVATILATTLVSQNVILLALLFIYRLKKFNPTVQGRPGSEFRLFTVALMLGNKFLDDNTYTNKTWAEVSGISVGEIHIMEVEFLSNMRYSLFVSASEWERWHKKLGQFWRYWDRARNMPAESIQYQMSTMQAPPMNVALPSPPPSTNSSPPYFAMSPNTPAMNGTPVNQLPAPVALNPPHLPHMPMPQPDFDPLSRKRSIDYTGIMQPPAKRVTRSAAPQLSVNVPQFPVQGHTNSHNQLLPPLQNLEYSTAPPMQMPPATSNYPSMPATVQTAHPMLVLPPSQPLQTQLPPPVSRVPHQTYSQPTLKAMTSVPASHSLDLSPYDPPCPAQHSVHHSAASSPTTPGCGSQRSPTWILGNRDSPYRPVRAVNKLLIPPPVQAPQAHPVAYEQMHYQPLTKSRSEYRTGVVPYLQPDISWSQQWPEPHFAS